MKRCQSLLIPLFILLLTAATCNGGENKLPSLRVTPTTLTLTAGGAATVFTATLENATGEVSWTLEPNLGTLSSSTGLETSYTPPASVATSTEVTLTASSGSLSATATITVNPASSGEDKTPPSIVSFSPANGATNVSAQVFPVVVFSEAIKADTITASSVKLSSASGAIDKRLLLSDDGKTLTIDYQNLLQPPGVVTITLEPTITDLAGNALQTQSWSFEVPFWETLSTALDVTVNHFAFEPSIGVGSSDNPDEQNLFVAWYEQDSESGLNSVYVKAWNGDTWQQLGDALNTSSSSSASDPSLVVDDDNRPVVAFQENDSVGGSSVFVKRWSGSTWVTQGSAVATGSAEHPSLAISQGLLGIAYANSNGANKAIYFKLFNGVTWLPLGAELNDVTTQNADFPSLDITLTFDEETQAVPFVAFQEADGTSNNIYVKTWDQTTTSWVKVGDELDVVVAKEATHPSLRLFGTSPLVAWEEEGSTNTDIYVKSFMNPDWIAVGNDDYKDQAASEPFVATFSKDQVSDAFPFDPFVVVWRGNDDTGQNVYGKSYSFRDGGWVPIPETGLEPLNTPGKAGENPVMTLGTYDAYIAFAEFDSSTNSTNLVVKRYNTPPLEPQ